MCRHPARRTHPPPQCRERLASAIRDADGGIVRDIRNADAAAPDNGGYDKPEFCGGCTDRRTDMEGDPRRRNYCGDIGMATGAADAVAKAILVFVLAMAFINSSTRSFDSAFPRLIVLRCLLRHLDVVRQTQRAASSAGAARVATSRTVTSRTADQKAAAWPTTCGQRQRLRSPSREGSRSGRRVRPSWRDTARIATLPPSRCATRFPS